MNNKDTIPALPGFGPVAPLERIETLDILRGFALLCILIVNWTVDAPWENSYWQGYRETADVIAFYTIDFFLDEKSWIMFAFLFGLGFTIQMQRAEFRGTRFLTVYSRRLIILFLIGAAHFIFSERDILYRYAICGFFLIPFRKIKVKLLGILALILIIGVFTYSSIDVYKRYKHISDTNNAKTVIPVDSALLDSYLGVYEIPNRKIFVMRDKNKFITQHNAGRPIRLLAESNSDFFTRSSLLLLSFVNDSNGIVQGLHVNKNPSLFRKVQSGQPVINDVMLRQLANKGKGDSIYTNGSFGAIVSMRASEFWKKISSWISYIEWLANPFPMFLLGLYAGRKRIFQDIPTNRKFIKKVMWLGLAFGLAAQTIKLVWLEGIKDYSTLHFGADTFVRLIYLLGSPALGLGYVAGLTLLLQRNTWKKKLAAFAPVGQMALTNYLLQSVAFVFLCWGYGLGWSGKYGAFGGVLLAVSFFALQIIFSKWWLRHFRFGPFEWLWRSLTYWKKQPMMKK